MSKVAQASAFEELQKNDALEKAVALRNSLNTWIENKEIPRGTVVFFFNFQTGSGSCFSHGLSPDDVGGLLVGMGTQITESQESPSLGDMKLSD